MSERAVTETLQKWIAADPVKGFGSAHNRLLEFDGPWLIFPAAPSPRPWSPPPPFKIKVALKNHELGFVVVQKYESDDRNWSSYYSGHIDAQPMRLHAMRSHIMMRLDCLNIPWMLWHEHLDPAKMEEYTLIMATKGKIYS